MPNDGYNILSLVSKINQHLVNYLPVYFSIKKSTFKMRMIEMLKGNAFSFFRLPKDIPRHLEAIFEDKYSDCMLNIKDWLCDSSSKVIINGVPLCDSITVCIENELKQKMLSLYGEIISLQRLLTVVTPKIVFAQHSLGINYALGEICLKENIPALLISHGSHTPQKNSLAAYEWSVHAHTIINSMYPFVALQTPWTKKFWENQDKVISKDIKTGPLLFAHSNFQTDKIPPLRRRLFGNNNAKKRIILHAGSPRAWQSYRPWIYETFDEYIKNINTIINAVDALSGLYLAIRFRPQEFLNLEDFKSSLEKSSCYGIYSDCTFEEYLISSDLLVSYSSTTIEESLQHHKPVLQYDPDGKYEHIKGQLLSVDGKNSLSTVYSVLNEKDLMPALDWWKNCHSADVNKKLDWTEHTFDVDDNMEWLNTMGITEC